MSPKMSRREKVGDAPRKGGRDGAQGIEGKRKEDEVSLLFIGAGWPPLLSRRVAVAMGERGRREGQVCLFCPPPPPPPPAKNISRLEGRTNLGGRGGREKVEERKDAPPPPPEYLRTYVRGNRAVLRPRRFPRCSGGGCGEEGGLGRGYLE